MIDWLPNEVESMNQECVYPKDKIPTVFEVVPLANDGVLILNWDSPNPEERLWLKFAVLRWNSSESDGKNVTYACEFHGEGPSGNLRELRHTYWGDNGYLFYLDGALIAAALKELSKYYDGVSTKGGAE